MSPWNVIFKQNVQLLLHADVVSHMKKWSTTIWLRVFMDSFAQGPEDLLSSRHKQTCQYFSRTIASDLQDSETVSQEKEIRKPGSTFLPWAQPSVFCESAENLTVKSKQNWDYGQCEHDSTLFHPVLTLKREQTQSFQSLSNQKHYMTKILLYYSLLFLLWEISFEISPELCLFVLVLSTLLVFVQAWMLG